MRMLSMRDAYVAEYISGATEMLLGLLSANDVGSLQKVSLSRETDRDILTAEFTLAKRPGVTYRIERTAYSDVLQAQLSAESAVSVLFGTMLEVVHLPAGDAEDGVVTV